MGFRLQAIDEQGGVEGHWPVEGEGPGGGQGDAMDDEERSNCRQS